MLAFNFLNAFVCVILFENMIQIFDQIFEFLLEIYLLDVDL